MKNVTASVAVAPMRLEPSHRSEMISQLLQGETALVLETGKDFTLIRCRYDDYEGWCANNQLTAIEPPPAEPLLNANIDPAQLKSEALSYLDVPYLWGGKSRNGIDCSGFSQQVFRACGVWLPRDSYQQAGLGEVVGFLEEGVCGDLAFFDNDEGKITHVGILLGNNEIIHASGKVRIDKIDHLGIVNVETGERTHRLRIIKRYPAKR